MSAFKTWLNGLTSKTTPVDADEMYLRDSVGAASNKVTWANLKATLLAYFDTAYLKLTGGTLSGNLFLPFAIFNGGGNESARLGYNQLNLNSVSLIGWTNSTTSADASGVDLSIWRDAANTLAQRNGTNAQAFRTYGTYTDASNYRRVAIAMTTAGVATLTPEGAGTGASGNVLHISGLPTSNPGAGILWNDSGTVKVGT
jgi:hypothetical protein